MNPDSHADLELFVEKADLLVNSSFGDSMLRSTSAFMLEADANGHVECVLVGAEGESVDAAFLTLRMFMQNNDRISLGNIGQIYASEPDLQHLRSEYERGRAAINQYLDSHNGIDFFGHNYTNREALDLLMFGSKGHTNRDKEKRLKELTKSSIIGPMFLNQVNGITAILIGAISELANLNKMALGTIPRHGV
jgi:hypothetical protein